MDGEASRDRDAELMDGLPQTLHSALTPQGEIEQFGKIATGVRAPREGWRRIVVPAGLVLMVVVLLSGFVACALSHP